MKVGISESSLYSITHAITTLQSSISKILELAPNSKEYVEITSKLSQNDAVVRNLLLNNPQIKLAVSLKTLYDDKKLKILDDVRNFNPALVDNVIVEPSADVSIYKTAPRVPSQQEKGNTAQDDDLPADIDAENYDVLTFLEKFEELYPPPLPRINNPENYSRVFTHKSLARGHFSKIERLQFSNEKLEFLGDSYLNTIVTSILYEWFPMLDEGELSNLRSSLVCNAQLRVWSKTYQLHKKLKTNLKETDATADLDTKRYADVFEAYIGALVLDSNEREISGVKNWLKILVLPSLKKFIANSPSVSAYIKDGYLADTNAPISAINLSVSSGNNGGSVSYKINLDSKHYSQELYSLIGYAKNPPDYQVTDIKEGNTPAYEATVSMGGELLGRGTGRNMKEAKNMAAKDALFNHEDLVNKYYLKRLAIPKEESMLPRKRSFQSTEPISSNNDWNAGAENVSNLRGADTGSNNKGLQIGEEKNDEAQEKQMSSKKKNKKKEEGTKDDAKKQKSSESVIFVPELPASKIDLSVKGKFSTMAFSNNIPFPKYRSVSEGPGRFKCTLVLGTIDVAYCLAESEQQGEASLSMWGLKNLKKLKKRIC